MKKVIICLICILHLLSHSGCGFVYIDDSKEKIAYNDTITFDAAYHLMVDSSILKETRFTSFRDSIMLRSAHALGSTERSEGSPSKTIDFFFATSKVNALRTRTVINMTAATTDHFPIYTDISFTK